MRQRLLSLRGAARVLGRRCLPSESRHLFALTLVVGVFCGLVAVAFHLTIRAAERLLIERALHAPDSSWMAWTILTPTLGGLLAGALLTWVVPGARGSGIPQVKQAYAIEGGRIRARDALGKFFIGALQIGSGASLGREGPTVQICAGAASLLARATALPARNMRRLTPVGVAAGIAAAFNAPIAAVTFTIEEIVGTLDGAVLSGVVVAAALAAVIERGILGVHPVIQVQDSYGLDHASSLLFYALLGITAACVSVMFSDGLLKLRLLFRKQRVVPIWLQPAIGGLMTGILAVVMLRFFQMGGITGGGYETLGLALAGQLGARVLMLLCAAKLVATVFSYSSGGAGGIFAPSLFVGAMLGGVVGHLDVIVMGHESRQLGAFALVGMGAVFAGMIRAPITSVLIIFEMTGGYGLVLPLMLANVTAYMLARSLRPVPIYEALLAQDGITLPHGVPSGIHALDRLCVEDAMTSNVITVQPSHSIAEAKALVAEQSFSRLPVVDTVGSVLGVVPVAQLKAHSDDPTRSIATLMQTGAVIPANAPLLRAVVSMTDQGVRQLLVVDKQSESRLLGVLTMSDLVRAHAHGAPSSVQPVFVPQQRCAQPVELCAGTLMLPARLVAASTSINELIAALRDGQTQALIVEAGTSDYAVILPEYLYDYESDDELQSLSRAIDLARPAPKVSRLAGLPTLVRAMARNGIDAAVVGGDGEVASGVVTKSALVSVFFEWYVSRGGAAAAWRSEVPIGKQGVP